MNANKRWVKVHSGVVCIGSEALEVPKFYREMNVSRTKREAYVFPVSLPNRIS